MDYFLGADIGATKTHILITDGTGQALGLGEAGPGNHEVVGYPGMLAAIQTAATAALAQAGLTLDQITGAGFGVAGYDWPSQEQITLETIAGLRLKAPVLAVNDTILGLLAGSTEGWGIAVVSGTSCNCWGWDSRRERIGRVTGGSGAFGENAGSTEIVAQALKAVSHAWTTRGPATALSGALVNYAGAKDVPDLLSGLMQDRYMLSPAAAPLIFQVAAAGDPVALDLIRWAGRELGELALCVIRQLDFAGLDFDIVQIGSMYRGSPLLTEIMQETVWAHAPRARFVRLNAPVAVGAVLLGMEAAGRQPDRAQRERMIQSASL